jgi:hypothetical protein
MIVRENIRKTRTNMADSHALRCQDKDLQLSRLQLVHVTGPQTQV